MSLTRRSTECEHGRVRRQCDTCHLIESEKDLEKFRKALQFIASNFNKSCEESLTQAMKAREVLHEVDG